MAKDNAFSEIFKVLKKGPIAKDEILNSIPGFMFCRFLGAHPITIAPANEFNKFHKQIPISIQYKMIKQVFAGKGIFPTMLKKTPPQDNLDVLCTHFKISREQAKEYRTFLSDEEFNEISRSYEVRG